MDPSALRIRGWTYLILGMFAIAKMTIFVAVGHGWLGMAAWYVLSYGVFALVALLWGARRSDAIINLVAIVIACGLGLCSFVHMISKAANVGIFVSLWAVPLQEIAAGILLLSVSHSAAWVWRREMNRPNGGDPKVGIACENSRGEYEQSQEPQDTTENRVP
jgi:hypothetical protein